ncbi:MAG: hypothetical protein NTZ29_15530, partial [Verrucomicrobia bacterium]|nr:hypothetical protein [Verrucomicrobiota bacterium]
CAYPTAGRTEETNTMDAMIRLRTFMGVGDQKLSTSLPEDSPITGVGEQAEDYESTFEFQERIVHRSKPPNFCLSPRRIEGHQDENARKTSFVHPRKIRPARPGVLP